MTALCKAQYLVSIETSGALDLSKIDTRVCRIMDIKTPGSGEATKNNWQNLAHLTQRDEIKFVIYNEVDIIGLTRLFTASNYIRYVQFYFHLLIKAWLLRHLQHGFYVMLYQLECRFRCINCCGEKDLGIEVRISSSY
jgi:hypothetical protein